MASSSRTVTLKGGLFAMESQQVIRKHLGHLFIDCMRQYPDAVCQIDAATGEEESCASVLSRSVRLAKCFRKCGLKPGDVLSLGGGNHLNIHIPYYAALLCGLPISGVDPYFKFDEIKSLLNITRPKIAFCQQESYDYYAEALKDLGLDTSIVTFDGEKNNLAQFIKSFSEDDTSDEFAPAHFDTGKVYAFLISTSGTTGGTLKVAAFTHDVILNKFELFKRLLAHKKEGRTVTLHLSPVQWVSSFVNALALPMLNQIKLQTSKPDDEDHLIEMINKYKPAACLIGPSLAATLLHRKDEVDLTCFRAFTVSGSKVNREVIEQLKTLLRKDVQILEPYGLTEVIGPITFNTPRSPPGSCGVAVPPNEIKLVDPESGKEITEPHVTGELWVRGPGFTEYYNDPESTAAAFTEDGYFKSGDLLYRDENNEYYFVDRIKSLIKYRNSHVLPAEIEAVILTHPSVRLACVCGVTHSRDGQRAAACVELKPGRRAGEQEIKDLVESKLSKNKQLHGGVVFVDQMPMTSSGKIAMGKVMEILNNSLAS